MKRRINFPFDMKGVDYRNESEFNENPDDSGISSDAIFYHFKRKINLTFIIFWCILNSVAK